MSFSKSIYLKLIVALIGMLFSLSSYSQGFYRLVSEDKIIDKRKKATVKIIVRNGDEVLSVGSGFFISQNGHILTNFNVVAPKLRKKDSTITIYTKDSTVIKTAKIERCSAKANIRTCLLSTNKRVKSFFKVRKQKLGSGNSLFVIGHCNERFRLAKGTLISSTSKDMKISNNVCMGDSGAPIFSPVNGALLGMVNLNSFGVRTKFGNTSGITSGSLIKFINEE